MKAKYYIYKNLTKNCFSIRYRGKVIAHATTINAQGVSYTVNTKGRERVLRERKKYVHAFVVCDAWQDITGVLSLGAHNAFLEENFSEVKYNPYTSDCFMIGDRVAMKSSHAVLHNGKVYARHSETS